MNQQLLETLESSPMMPPPSGILQRQCACGNHTGGGECDSCRKGAVKSDAVPSAGTPLSADTRAFFEPRFGADFSNVRVHSDASAAESARTLQAHAFTVGRDIVFGNGQYAPETGSGKRLLAHELAHVVQQGNASSSVQTKSLFSSSSDRAEQEATRVADRVVAGERVEISQQPAALVQGNGALGAGIGAGAGALAGGLIGLAVGGPIGGLIGLGIGALAGGLIGWLAGRGRSACDVFFDRVRQHRAYRGLVAATRAIADDIISVALPRPNCMYYAQWLLYLFETPDAPRAAPGQPPPQGSTLELNRATVEPAAAAERARLATPEAQQQLRRQEQVADDPNRVWTLRAGEPRQDGRPRYYRVDNRDPNNIVVRIKIRLQAAPGATTAHDIENQVILEDAIERVAETRGYVMDVIFVDSDADDVFTFTVDFDSWPTSGNPVGNARTLAHEIHHLMNLPDRYDYIRAHSGNPNLVIHDRLYWFREQMNRQPDPKAAQSLMGSGNTVLDDDACRVAGLDVQTCVAARQQGRAQQGGAQPSGAQQGGAQ